jgi:single-strand selective monofunctional uracil DNA glycosylase
LKAAIAVLQPEWVIGIGAFAAGRAREALGGNGVEFGQILHPSPASPAANRNWAGLVVEQLRKTGVWD